MPIYLYNEPVTFSGSFVSRLCCERIPYWSWRSWFWLWQQQQQQCLVVHCDKMQSCVQWCCLSASAGRSGTVMSPKHCAGIAVKAVLLSGPEVMSPCGTWTSHCSQNYFQLSYLCRCPAQHSLLLSAAGRYLSFSF